MEPNEAMVGKFKALQPNIAIYECPAHDLPFEDRSIDAVCVAQVCRSPMFCSPHITAVHALQPCDGIEMIECRAAWDVLTQPLQSP